MARPKKRREPEPEERVSIIHLKGSAEYNEWFTARNEATHIPKATLVRLAIAAYAKAQGWPDPPKL